MLRPFLFALSFLTRLPLPASVHEVSARTLARGPLYFPLVGGLLGLFTGALSLAFASVLPSLLAVLLALAFEARLTGAMHEDALADSADALGGGWTRERTLEIFKDSRLGTYGVLALCFGVAIRALATEGILLRATQAVPAQPAISIGSCMLAGFVGRLQMLFFLKSMPPIRGRKSLSGELGDGIGWAAILFASLPLLACLPFTRELGGASLCGAILLLGVLHLVAQRTIQRRLGGSTGDVLGAMAFLSQLIVLVALAAR